MDSWCSFERVPRAATARYRSASFDFGGGDDTPYRVADHYPDRRFRLEVLAVLKRFPSRTVGHGRQRLTPSSAALRP